ncbi:Camkk protein kinase, partial [Globisporangium splendens]
MKPKTKTKWQIVETHRVTKLKRSDGTKCVNNYELKHTLGQGQFAKVKLCERIAAPVATTNATAVGVIGPPPPPPTFSNGAAPQPSRRRFAMKIFSKQTLLKMKEYVAEPQTASADADGEVTTASRMRVVTALDHVRDEIAIMRTLYHRNIVLLFEVIECDTSEKIYMVMEYMPQGVCMAFDPDTKTFASPLTGGVLSDEWAKAHMRDILNGLAYLHARRICHRDLKPSNILLNAAGRCHLTDFGCAVAFPDIGDSGHLVSDTVGTYQFLSPECCSGEPYDPFKVDLWAVGVLLYIFLFGKLPFQSEGTKELFDEITRCDGIDIPTSLRHVASECRDLLLRLLTKDPQERITVTDALNHPWLVEPDDDEEPLSF